MEERSPKDSEWVYLIVVSVAIVVIATRSIVVAARPVVVVTSRPIIAVAWSVIIVIVLAVSSCNLVLAWKLVAIIGVVIVAKQPSRPTNGLDIERIEYP